MLKYLLLALAVFGYQPALAAEFMSIGNVKQPDSPVGELKYFPGALVVLPDGAVTIIEEELASGDYRTSNGAVITQTGKVRKTNEEVKILRQTDLKVGATVKLPEGKEDIISEKLPDGTFKTKGGLLVTADGKVHIKISHVESFEEAEQFLAKGEKAREDKEDPGDDPIAQLLALDEPVKSEPEKQQKPVFVAKKGDKLTIPPGAAARKDYSFLKGCWRSRAVTYYDGFTPYRAPAEICFNGGDRGRFLSYTGGVCSAQTSARFNSGILLIQAARGPCNGGKFAYTMPRMFQCEGEGSQTECYILAKDDTDKRRKFKSRARFYKK